MLTIIGDVHGHHDEYLKILENADSTVQVGDFGLDWDVLQFVSPAENKIIGGNHDNYDIVNNYPHYLGDYGTTNIGGVDFFFVRGERSVDAHLRTEGVSWWRNEELSMAESYAAIENYISAKPSIVISHGCPAEVIQHFCTNNHKLIHPSRTSQMMDAMFAGHQPDLWIFGHHHNSMTKKIGTTKFVCLNELETMTL